MRTIIFTTNAIRRFSRFVGNNIRDATRMRRRFTMASFCLAYVFGTNVNSAINGFVRLNAVFESNDY